MSDKTIIISNEASYIRSHVIQLFVQKHPQYQIFNLGNLTNAGKMTNLKDIESGTNYQLVKGNIEDCVFLQRQFNEFKSDAAIHLEVESHLNL